MSDSKTFQIPEEMVARYASLNEKAKRIEEELAEMKKSSIPFLIMRTESSAKGKRESVIIRFRGKSGIQNNIILRKQSRF
ncbi:hypothetical protein MGI18_04225 [Bacillus sp. OVS6]|nr:hypothetical protein MGI18_04225 [Bacillus sp. OVS6]